MDISVKIAFGLNKLKGGVDVINITSLAAIREISNQQRCNSSLFFTEKEAIARIRQASNNDIRENTNKLLTAMEN